MIKYKNNTNTILHLHIPHHHNLHHNRYPHLSLVQNHWYRLHNKAL